ncbi:MAG: M1 family metallopeptidase [Bacteroidota bacterium]
MKNILFIIFCLQISHGFSQNYNPNLPPNTYQNSDNPYYWKNRKPHAAYWQQDVYYNIKAFINDSTDIITAKQELTYWNNSPDTLTYVYFHLYQNAFQPDSYLDNLQKNNNVKPVYGKYETQKKGTEINTIKVNGSDVKTELDNTILKVYLPQALLPQQSIQFTIDFSTYFDSGSTRRRMKKFTAAGLKHFDGVHWYPRISVYDNKFGWDTQQHLGKEFYGDFGAFDLELNFPANYIVEATGFLTNRDEVLPKELREKLDIKNFAKKPWNSKPSILIPYNANDRKTWKYHTENVHDVAFTADPSYRIGETFWNGIQCVALVQEQHAIGWQNAADYTAKIIKTYSEDFGMYAYNKMVVADARDGMEYPMLTLDGGFDPDYRNLFSHEIGHNWFFGMVGNNETYRALLDEGFTQYLTVWANNKIDGEYEVENKPKSKYIQKHLEPTHNRDRYNYFGYLRDAVKGEDAFLNTTSDGFNGALAHGGGYGHVYHKTATMLHNLQYVLGDTLFQNAMKHYFNQWKIAHPYVEDFKNSIINYTKVDLNWFFDQWLETTKSIDYKIKSVKKIRNTEQYKIIFERKERMQMPIDFTVVTNDNKKYSYHIPNTWFVKSTKNTVLPKWYGWDKLQPNYTATITIPGKIKNVIIDTTGRLADINHLNNSLKTPVNFGLDHKIYNAPNFRNYELKWRPDVWYNGFDGIKAGVHFNGNYFNYKHIFDFTAWYNTRIGQQSNLYLTEYKSKNDLINSRFNYRTATDRFMKKSAVFAHSSFVEGLFTNKIGFEKTDERGKNKFYVFAKSIYRKDSASLNYLLNPTQWAINNCNNTINLGVDHTYNYSYGSGKINLNLKSSTLFNNYNYAQLSLTSVNQNRFKKLDIKTRVFAQIGTGSLVPQESALYLAGANPEEMMENKFVRSIGYFPNAWSGFGTTTNHFQYGGGLNLRGYAGYLAPEVLPDGTIRNTYIGNSGAAFNTEINFERLFSFIKTPKLSRYFGLQTYAFADAGLIDYKTSIGKTKMGYLRADAGLGTTFTIKKWFALQTVEPLTIRFDMPLFLNSIPASETSYFKFRWILSVSKSF